MTRLGFFALILATAAPVVAQQPPASEPPPPLSKEQEREKFHTRTRSEGMEAARRLEGFARRLEMERTSPLAALKFRNVGPEIQGGRIVDIEAPLASPDSLLVAFASGGLWRTDNRGGSWTPLFDDQSSMAIGDIALGDAEAKVIYVGTGENNSSRTSYSGTGIFKTTDGGSSWRHLGLADSHRIGRILVDPRDPQVVYVAASGHLYTENAERGVFKTRDGGESWTRVLFVDDRTGAIDLIQSPQRPDILYAAMWERARTAANFLESGPGSGIWKSLDAGETWTRLSGGFPQGATVGRIGLALAASQPDTVYAVLDNQALRPDTEPFDEETPPGELTTRRLRRLDAEQFARLPKPVIARFLKRNEFPKTLKPAALKRDVEAGKITLDDLLAYVKDANRDLFENPVIGPEVYRSDDGGASWKRTHEGRIDKVFYSYGYYFARITVDPTDPERVYFGGVPLLGSADGGRTWTGLDQRGVHADHHALHIDPSHPHRLALGNDGGLNLSFDYGQTWTKVNNLPVGQFTTLALDDDRPYNILGGLQDNGVLRGPSSYERGKDDPAAWKTILGGDGSAVVVDPKDRNVVYTAFQFGHAFRLDLKSGSRTRIRPRPELSAEKKEKPLRYNWVTPFVLSPHSNNILYFGANRLYRSFDRGDIWTAISGDLTSDAEQGDVPFGTLTTISESPKSFGVIYAGTDEGKVWGTRDGGVTWKDLSEGLATDRWVTRVVASAFDEGTVYVSQSGYRNDDFAPYVFRSADFGEEWESLAGGLPAEPVNTVREDPEARHALYVGTDHGAFASLDRGETWIPLTGGLPRVPVHDLLVHPREGDLVLATHGRSVYVAQAAPLRKLTASVMEEPLHAFSIKKAQADPGRGYGEHPYISWRQKRPVVRIAYWLGAATGAATEITIEDEHGSPWTRLEGTAREGLNVVEYDLSADPKLATAAEAVARSKALEEVERQKQSAEPSGPEPAEEAEDDDTEEAELSTPPLDDELHALLDDPLRDSRRRYLPPGKYKVEIRAGELKESTRLSVEAPEE